MHDYALTKISVYPIPMADSQLLIAIMQLMIVNNLDLTIIF